MLTKNLKIWTPQKNVTKKGAKRESIVEGEDAKCRNNAPTSSPNIERENKMHYLTKLEKRSGHNSKKLKDRRKRTKVTPRLTVAGNHRIRNKRKQMSGQNRL